VIEKYFNLKGKKVFITGSTRGIGRALAKGFVESGCEVWIHGRKAKDCEAVAAQLGAKWINGDLSKKEEVSRIGDYFLSLGTLDILINNAAIECANPIEALDTELFDSTFDVNVKAVTALIYKLIPLLKKSVSGTIMNVTSIHQETPYPNHSAYCMSKAALGMLTKCLALELAPYNIRINNFAPGAIRTEINKKVVDEMEGDFKKWIPLGRVGSPDEMIGTALYLCSNASSYVTGATFYVDGGYREHIVRY